jgi:hypothetical protein
MPQRQLSLLNGRKFDHRENTPLVSIVTVLLCVSRFRGNMFTQPLLRNGRLFIRLLHSNGCTRYNIKPLGKPIGR